MFLFVASLDVSNTLQKLPFLQSLLFLLLAIADFFDPHMTLVELQLFPQSSREGPFLHKGFLSQLFVQNSGVIHLIQLFLQFEQLLLEL